MLQHGINNRLRAEDVRNEEDPVRIKRPRYMCLCRKVYDNVRPSDEVAHKVKVVYIAVPELEFPGVPDIAGYILYISRICEQIEDN